MIDLLSNQLKSEVMKSRFNSNFYPIVFVLVNYS